MVVAVATTAAVVKKAKKEAIKVALPRGIRQRNSGRFIIDLTVNGTRRTATADTVEEAIELRLAMLAETKGGNASAATTTSSSSPAAAAAAGTTTWTLQEAFDRTMASVWSGLSSEKTNRINANTALDFFGRNTPVTAIDTDAVARYVIFLLDDKASDATINRKLSALSRILRNAMDSGQLEHLPKIARRKERQGRIRFLTEAEEQAVLRCFQHLGKHDHWDATVILLDTGFRTGELWGVTAEHVDLARGTYGTITLWRTKNDKARTIPMTHRVREVVIRRMKGNPYGLLFPNGGKDWYRQGWDKVRMLLGKDDDPEFVPHMLRHTCCSRLVQRGVPITHVQRWMGHNSLQTTMRYAHLMPHDLFSAVAVLEGGENARWDALPEPQADSGRRNSRNRKKPLLQ